MTIKRDILGTIVNIELTDEEITKAHISYLEQEIKSLKGAEKHETVVNSEKVESTIGCPERLLVECQMEWAKKTEQAQYNDYMSGLVALADELRGVHLHNIPARTRIINKYINCLQEARQHMTLAQIAAVTGLNVDSINRRTYRARPARCRIVCVA